MLDLLASITANKISDTIGGLIGGSRYRSCLDGARMTTSRWLTLIMGLVGLPLPVGYRSFATICQDIVVGSAARRHDKKRQMDRCNHDVCTRKEVTKLIELLNKP